MVALINTLLTQLAAVLRGSGVEAMGKHRRVMMRVRKSPVLPQQPTVTPLQSVCDGHHTCLEVTKSCLRPFSLEKKVKKCLKSD